MYKATVTTSSKELSARERIMMKDEKRHVKLNQMVSDSETQSVRFMPVAYAMVHVENPESTRSKEYEYLVVEDESGKTYATGSKSFIESFLGIWEEMDTDNTGETFEIEVYRAPSKNYETGFLTCSIL